MKNYELNNNRGMFKNKSFCSFLSSITLKEKIVEDLNIRKNTLSEKEIFLLQRLAGIQNPKK
jgi:hypothetical protein